jgi:hypothetical protein
MRIFSCLSINEWLFPNRNVGDLFIRDGVGMSPVSYRANEARVAGDNSGGGVNGARQGSCRLNHAVPACLS